MMKTENQKSRFTPWSKIVCSTGLLILLLFCLYLPGYGGTGDKILEKKGINVISEIMIDNTLPLCFIINAASASDDFLLFKAPEALTITHIYGVLLAGTNVVGGLDECDSNGANCAAVDSDITFNGSEDADDGSLSNPSIDQNDWVKWHTTSSSSPGYLTICVWYTIP